MVWPDHHTFHSSSRSRRTASLCGFFDLSHVFDRPLRYGASTRFDTMPSSPMRQTCSNTVGPSSVRCSVNRTGALRSSFLMRQGLESAVIKHVLDHIVNSPTVARVESAGRFADLFTLCSGTDCRQTKKLTDTANGNK